MRKPAKPMPRPKKRRTRQITARMLRRDITESKISDDEILRSAYLMITQAIEQARVPLRIAETALDMALDDCRDRLMDDSLSWCEGTPSVSRADQFAPRPGNKRR